MPVSGDFGVDIGRGQLVEPTLLGTGPGLLEPVGGRCGYANKILHAHDDGWFAAPVDDEALIVLCREIHDLPKLGPSDLGIDAALHNACTHRLMD